MRKMSRLLSVILACAMLLTACGGASQGGKDASGSSAAASAGERTLKDSLVVAIAAEPANLDPTISTNVVCRQVEAQVFNTLVRLNNDGKIVPELATSWEQLDDTTIRFHLREGVLFHNGEELTADDVVFTLKRLAVMGVNTSMYSAFDAENTAVVDKYTVDIKTNEPFAGAYNFLACVNAGIHCKSYVEKAGDETVAREPVGTGPFRFEKWKSGESIELKSFDNYWGDKPAYSQMSVKFITEASNRTIELETGGADIIYGVPVTDLNRLRENKDVRLIIGQGRRYTYITVNMKDPLFSDSRVREALACSLDIKAIADAVYGEMGTVADSIMNPQILGYKSMGVIPYAPEKARALLDEAGVDTLNVTLKMNEDNMFIGATEVMKNMWGKVGINAELQVLEMATYNEQGARGEVQLGISSYATASGDPDQALQTWKTTYNGQIQGNDLKIDELLLHARGEYDQDKRIAAYGDAIEYMWNTHYMIPIVFNNLAYATGSNVEGFEFNAGEMPYLSSVVVYER